MLRTILGAALLATLALPVGTANAGVATSVPMTRLPAFEGLVEKTQYRHCRRWNRECRYRWGHGWRYRRCMARHGC